jgi:hypothetical protein
MRSEYRKVFVGVAELAKEVGLTPSTVSDQLRFGKTPMEIRQRAVAKGRMSKEAYAAALQREAAERTREKYTKKRPQPKIDPELELALRIETQGKALAEARVRKEQALCEKYELGNMARRSELVPADQVAIVGACVVTVCADLLLNISEELKDQLATETNPGVIRVLLDDRLRQALCRIADTHEIWEGPLCTPGF